MFKQNLLQNGTHLNTGVKVAKT